MLVRFEEAGPELRMRLYLTELRARAWTRRSAGLRPAARRDRRVAARATGNDRRRVGRGRRDRSRPHQGVAGSAAERPARPGGRGRAPTRSGAAATRRRLARRRLSRRLSGRPARALTLELRAVTLLVESALDRRLRRLRRPARRGTRSASRSERRAARRELAVSGLAPLVLGDRAQVGRRAPPRAASAPRSAPRSLDVEERLDAGLRLLGVLAARPARAGRAEADLRERQDDAG